MKKVLAGVVMALALPAVSFAAGDAAAGQSKAAMCAGCHGADGMAVQPIYPNLKGQNAEYLEIAIKAYKTQERAGGNAAMMYGMVGGLSDQDIADLAAYFASL